jgi:hypothetical protein
VRVPSVPVLVRLRLAKDLMDRRYVDPLDLNALAREAGFSRFTSRGRSGPPTASRPGRT